MLKTNRYYISNLNTDMNKNILDDYVLTNKQYKEYDKLSRYSTIPFYYNTLDNKYISGTTKHLNDDTTYSAYTIKHNDSWDLIAFNNYGNPTLYWVILDYNRIIDPYIPPKPGSVIKIPVLSNISYDK